MKIAMNLQTQQAARSGGLFLLICSAFFSACAFGQAVDRKAIEPRQIDSPGVPGPVVAFGEQARVLAVGRIGQTFAPVIVAGQSPGSRSGRIVLFGHDGYLSAESLDKFETRPFFFETATWAARSGKARTKKSARPTVGLIGVDSLATVFEAQGWAVRKLDDAWPAKIANLDLVVSTAYSVTTIAQLKAIDLYVRGGGGWLVGITGWGWEQTHPGKSLAADLPIVRILSDAGLAVSSQTIEPAEPNGSMAVVRANELPLAHAGKALEKLAELSKANSKSKSKSDSKLDAVEAAQISSTLELALGAVGSQDSPFRKALAKLVESQPQRAITAARPIRKSDMIERLAVRFRHDLAESDRSAKLAADPSAADFPGSVPAKAARISRQVRFPAGSKGRLSTGLYAPPGGTVKFRMIGGTTPPGLQARIGAHSDTLWHLDSWERHPEITRVQPFPAEAAEFRISNPFGGLVYIESTKPLPNDFEITVEGVVQAPHYVLGTTSKDEWSKLRQAPAPWAELQSRHVGLVLPADTIRGLTDPKPLLELWDRVMDSQNELGSLRREFVPTQWILPDRQISAGYMHAGNPIMTGLDAAPFFANAEKLLADNPGGITWGILHEIGHNRQRDAWTPSGLGEVTNNLFALYVYDKLLGQASSGHPGLLKGQKRADALRKYQATGPNFETFKSDPFLALAFFMEIQEAFGWQPFFDHFAATEKLNRGSAPRTDEARWDAWLTGLSKSTGKNLTPHFEAWGIPVSSAAKESVTSLPKWTPKPVTP
ncbi:hypothetical protein GC170_20350 [bacterium]|nr:hypothetical protein [bacterium]